MRTIFKNHFHTGMASRLGFCSVILVGMLSLSSGSMAQEIKASMFYLPEADKHLMPNLVEAAKLALKTDKCAKVIDGSTTTKSTPSSPSFFVTCQNKSGRYFNLEYTLADISSGKSKDVRGVNREKALEVCTSAIRKDAAVPSTVDFHVMFGTSITEAPNGNVEVLMEFDAKNAIGAEMPLKARCLILPDGRLDQFAVHRR